MAEEVIRSPDVERKNRLPPGQRLTDRWPVLQHGSIFNIDISKWTFTISGLVKEKRVFSYQEFLSLPRVKVFSDIHCVTGWSKFNNLWEGLSTGAIRQLTELLPSARFVIVQAAGNFTTNLTLEDFFGSDVLFAITHDGETLAPAHGYPVRLVVPRLYFWKSAKWVTGIEFTAEDRPGLWESVGYHNHGDPWKEERYSGG